MIDRAIGMLILAAAAASPAYASDACSPGGEMNTIDSERDAACYLLYVAEELVADRDWCVALTGEQTAWKVALDLWVRRNREYLDTAARIAGGGKAFTLESPLLKERAPAVQVSEAQCQRDLEAIDGGSFDVDLVPLLRPLKRYLD